MTDLGRIIDYYSHFDEWGRLDVPEGRLESELLLALIERCIPRGATMLDLGGGPGRYTAILSRKGYHMHLADLSPVLIETARHKLAEYGDPDFIQSISIANATDLGTYADESFDAVLLFGPLYHLTTEREILLCISEVRRVLRPDGVLMAVYIPHISGVKSVLARALYRSDQADASTIDQVYDTGIYHNKSTGGFQEGNFLRSGLLKAYMKQNGFEQLLVRSVRGLGNGMEAAILTLKEKDIRQYRAILDLIDKTAEDPDIVESSGHAVYVGRKASRA